MFFHNVKPFTVVHVFHWLQLLINEVRYVALWENVPTITALWMVVPEIAPLLSKWHLSDVLICKYFTFALMKWKFECCKVNKIDRICHVPTITPTLKLQCHIHLAITQCLLPLETNGFQHSQAKWCNSSIYILILDLYSWAVFDMNLNLSICEKHC